MLGEISFLNVLTQLDFNDSLLRLNMITFSFCNTSFFFIAIWQWMSGLQLPKQIFDANFQSLYISFELYLCPLFCSRPGQYRGSRRWGHKSPQSGHQLGSSVGKEIILQGIKQTFQYRLCTVILQGFGETSAKWQRRECPTYLALFWGGQFQM